MKLLSSVVLVFLVGVALAQFKPLQNAIDNSPMKGIVDGLKNGAESLQGFIGGLGEAGSDVFDGFDKVLQRLGLTFADLTEDAIENIKNVTQQLAQIALNPANTFKVKLNENVIKPFQRGLAKMVDPGGRNFSDTKYNYTYVNYVELGQVSPVKDQGQCGACYAFAGVAAVEALYLRNKLGPKIFSEQQIIDCSIDKYATGLNNGCTSGASDAVTHYFTDVDVKQTKEYPYKAEVGKCAVTPSPSKQKFNFTTVLADNEDHLALILNENGPVVVYIYAGTTFNYYYGGIYNDFITSMQPVDHAVLVVGIEKDFLGQEYWIIKNSWGASWGEKGFIRFAKGSNIANMITNPVTVVNLGPIIY